MAASLIIFNARVATPQPSPATAVVVNGGQIVFLGDDNAALARHRAATRVIDARRRTLLPGLIDSHFHLGWGSRSLVRAPLGGITTRAELRAVLLRYADAHPQRQWLWGGGLSYLLSPDNNPLTRHDLDAIIADRPLVLAAYDLHTLFANTAALRAAGILYGAPQPLPPGALPLAADGTALGILIENDAMRYINAAQPAPTEAEQLDEIRASLAYAAAYGITFVHNMDGELAQARLYATLAERGELTLRINLPYRLRVEDSVEHMLEEALALQALQGDLLRGSGVKFFMDGVLETHTAVMLDGYADRPGHNGEPIWPAERFAAYVTAADRHGLQVATHACGDGAVRMALDGYATAQRANGRRDSRHRIEHIEMLGAADLPRFAALGVTASMQPLHVPTPGSDLWLERVPAEELDRAFAWQTLRAAGATLVFGSDWSVASADTFAALHAAVNRRPYYPDQPEQRQTLAQALDAYTVSAAWAGFREQQVGQIAVGMAADLVLLSDDLFGVPQDTIDDICAVLTVSDGRVVYEHNAE